jgi:carboxyl-terminal processing protease
MNHMLSVFPSTTAGRASTLALVVCSLCLLFTKNGLAGDRFPEAQDPYRLLDQLGQTLQAVEENYFEPVDRAELLEGALRGLVHGLDPHSSYFSPEDLAIFEGDTTGTFGGIGVEVDFRDDRVIVIAPVEGSPADRAGVRSGDVIVSLDGRPLDSDKPDEVVRLMRGEAGSPLRLVVLVQATGTLKELTLVRERISVKSVVAQLLDADIAYVRIKSFQEGTHRELLQTLGELRKTGPAPQGLILDLRNNPGGLVREATAVADEFLSSGVVYSTRHRETVIRTVRAHSGGAYHSGPLVVLVNEFSASAAELLAGALKDHSRAVLVGARSFGKGSVQTLLPLGYGGALKLTTALYYTPRGSTLQARGVAPHVTVNPGYPQNSTQLVVRESDLSGHIGPEESNASDARGPPPTNEELHLGVARTVRKNPENGPDLALGVAYRIVRGDYERKSPLSPP